MNLRILGFFFIFAGVVGFSGQARAGVLNWDWSYQTIDPGDTSYSGSGTFTTEDTTMTNGGFTGYLITGITGTMNAETITGIVAPGGFGGNDNLVAVSSPQLDNSGFTFLTDAGTWYNPFWDASYSAGSENDSGYGGGSDYLGNFSADVVPEPSQYGSLVFLAVAFGIAWRRFSLRTSQSA